MDGGCKVGTRYFRNTGWLERPNLRGTFAYSFQVYARKEQCRPQASTAYMCCGMREIKKILKEKKTENWESVGNSRGGYAAVPKACVLQMVEFARVELPCVATYNVGVRCSRVVNSILMAVSS